MKINMKVHSLEQEGKCVARLSATLDDSFVIRGLRLMEGKNGLFVNFPSYKGRSGYGAVAAYRQALEHHQGQAERIAGQGQAEIPVQAVGQVMQMG